MKTIQDMSFCVLSVSNSVARAIQFSDSGSDSIH